MNRCCVELARAWFVMLSVIGLAVSAMATITIPTVLIGDPSNTADPSTGFGAVAHVYNISTYEVTAGQYTAFLNAVAATDTHGLYNPDQANTSWGSGIQRSGISGAYTYSVDAAFVNRPVNYVSFWDACRFANWLHNGQPAGLQSNTTTEDGAYTLSPAVIANNTVTRNAGWQWAVTSEDEWYKAAYYKGGGQDAGYWLYPTGSNTTPGRDLSDPAGNNANLYYGSGAYPIQSPFYTTVVGEFQNSASPYGTFDQGGNAFEWNEAIILGSSRGLRGGSFYNFGIDFLRADNRFKDTPTKENDSLGFRVTHIDILGQCPGDVDGDASTNVADFNILASHFGTSVPAGTLGDLNYDGLVNVADFNILAADFGCVAQ